MENKMKFDGVEEEIFIDEKTGKKLEKDEYYGDHNLAQLNRGDFVELYDGDEEKLCRNESKTLTMDSGFLFQIP